MDLSRAFTLRFVLLESPRGVRADWSAGLVICRLSILVARLVGAIIQLKSQITSIVSAGRRGVLGTAEVAAKERRNKGPAPGKGKEGDRDEQRSFVPLLSH